MRFGISRTSDNQTQMIQRRSIENLMKLVILKPRHEKTGFLL